eukprot:362342-Chlamydomonas_euryale.AAC.4
MPLCPSPNSRSGPVTAATHRARSSPVLSLSLCATRSTSRLRSMPTRMMVVWGPVIGRGGMPPRLPQQTSSSHEGCHLPEPVTL